ncbi:hypothetical protein [Streptomyces iranensis]|uniref:Uncharacterized protein n=1 Tax=Streptomyces iranensis TaxID=576784 RepID=A0A061A1E0_9ACTN|nr:hypothetical protein [Streptomyces iranensis]MBP2061606.1 hypothetical protein [Streptomyces iranensis]CDR09568.1 predicted protein [Streptomyces iranensis]
MHDAWRAVFRAAETAAPSPTSDTLSLTTLGDVPEHLSLDEIRDLYAERATLDTPLEQSGLTPRAQGVAADFGATTVRELLNVPLYRFQQKQRGIGVVVKRELHRRHRQWTAALRAKKPTTAPAKARRPAREEDDLLTASLDARLPIERLAGLLNPPRPGRKDNKLPQVIAAFLGLPAPEGVPDAPPWTCPPGSPARRSQRHSASPTSPSPSTSPPPARSGRRPDGCRRCGTSWWRPSARRAGS